MTSKEAYNLLCDKVIKNKDDLNNVDNRWIGHCYYVGEAAGRIAEKLNLDADYAKSLGYLHDIGRKINHYNHPMEGYNYLKKLGYENEANICLTHSFIDNNINLTAGGGPDNHDAYEFINNFLITKELTIYDNIVQLCDLFCLANGFTTVENRLLDIYSRKGIYTNTQDHFDATLELKNRIERMMGCNLYDLFPEIKKEEIGNIKKDSLKLQELINKEQKEYRVGK